MGGQTEKAYTALDVVVSRADTSSVPAANFKYVGQILVGLDGSVGIAICYGLDGPAMESRWGRDIPHPSTPALGPTHCTMGTG
jgi:hypothetical protein